METNDETAPSGEYAPDVNYFFNIGGGMNLDYVNDTLPTIQNSNLTNNYESSRSIELLNLSMNNKFNSEVNEIINIEKDLLKFDDFELNKDYENDEEFLKEKKFLDDKIKIINEINCKLKEHQDKLIDCERKYKESFQQNKDDINKISEFKNFLVSINTKYKDIDPSEINTSILNVSKKISENNESLELKENYNKQNYIYNYYLHKYVKTINGLNNGSTCSICLQKQVDTYLEPCGHTVCADCVTKIKGNDEYNVNCFICRKNVIRFNKLYYL